MPLVPPMTFCVMLVSMDGVREHEVKAWTPEQAKKAAQRETVGWFPLTARRIDP